MKLLIEINDYEKLKDIVETAMNNKHRKTKDILFWITSLLSLVSLALMINAICDKKSVFTIIFFILTLAFLCCSLNILTSSGAHLVNIYNKIQEMQENYDEHSCMQIENWVKYDNTFVFEYFDKDGIMQKASVSYEKRYIHKYDYYKIAGKLNKNEDNYIFYLYEPYRKGESL